MPSASARCASRHKVSMRGPPIKGGCGIPRSIRQKTTGSLNTFFSRQSKLDPTFAGGYNGLAISRITAATRFATIDLVEAARSAEELARRALALDPSNAGGCTCLSWALLLRGDFEGALSEAHRALVLSPSLAGAHSTMGAVLIFSGQLKEGLAEEQTALRLDPRSPTRADHLLRIAAGHYFCGAYEDAVEAAKQAI